VRASGCVFLLLTASPLSAGYQYYLSDSLRSIDAASWSSTGQLTAGAPGLAATDTNGGSLISRLPIPGGSSEAEVTITVALSSSGGTYTAFLQSSADARTGAASAGSYLAFEMQNPQFDTSHQACAANFVILQRAAGVTSLVAAFPHACRNGMRMRMAVHGGTVLVWPDQPDAMEFNLGATGGGQPGIGAYGVPAGNSISQVQLGAIDRTPPAAVDALKLTATVFRKRVELKWAPAADDSNGIGLAGYWVYRDGLYLARTSNTQFADEAVTAGETHTYAVRAIDGHFNSAAPASVAVAIPTAKLTPLTATITTTPPPTRIGTKGAEPRAGINSRAVVGTPQADSGGGLDPRRTGVRALGAYWGGGGESIDTISGNLNFSVPLLSPQNRGGNKITFALSYNSQIWRKDASGTTLLGQDTGYGLGWKLQAGAIIPVWTVSATIDHYIFMDATGAEYSLNVSNNNVWTSQEGIYVSFDADADILYFNDGSHWWMGCISGNNEADAGTLYPLTMWDTNGNYTVLEYMPGIGQSQPNTSARLHYIWDSRTPDGVQPVYTFSYTNIGTGPVHLSQIACAVPNAENYSFGYLQNQAVNEPFSNSPSGSFALLQTLTTSMGPWSAFAYNSFGELYLYSSPLGGNLQWLYRTFSYASGVSLREVSTRAMQSMATDSWHSYSFYRDDDPANPAHYWTTLWDNDAKAWKVWVFNLSGAAYGLESLYYEAHPLHGTGIVGDWTLLFYQYPGWTQDNGNLYSNNVVTIPCDSNGANCISTTTTQVLDAFGNLTSRSVYDYSNPSTPARSYSLAYINDVNYTARYIRNRLTVATVTAGGATTTLVQNNYDVYATSCNGSSGMVSRTGLPLRDDADFGTAFIYRGNVTSRTSVGGSASVSYESTGVLACSQDGARKAVTTSPSADTSYSLPGVFTPNSNSALSTSLTYNSSWEVTSVTGPNGVTATTTYDSYGRPAQSTMPEGAQTSYTYTYYPTAPNTQTATMTASDLTNAIWKRTTLDGFGRAILAESGYGGNEVSVVWTQYAPCGCSPLGKMYRTSLPYAPGDPTLWTTYAYDERGRTVSITLPDGSVTSMQYPTTVTDPAGNTFAGSLVKTTDAAGKWKIQQMDAFGNLIKVLEPNPAGGAWLITSYTYTALNQLSSVTMPRSNGTQTRTFTYSGTDMVSATNPENGTVAYTYDGAHHVLTKTDARGQQIHYSYDTYGRLTDVDHYALVNGQLTEQVAQRVRYYYDSNTLDPGFSNNVAGRLAVVEMHDWANLGRRFYYEYDYESTGRVHTQRLKVVGDFGQASDDFGTNAGQNFDVGYSWNNEGRPSSIHYPSGGPTYNYGYDGMGRLNYMVEPGVSAATATYGVAGQVLGLTYFGVNETRTYNSLFQMTRMTANTVLDMQYIYTPGQNNGRIASSIDGISGETVNYTYDELNRLTGASATNGAWGQSFTYDGFGNLTDKTPTAGSAPSLHVSIDPLTNREIGPTYDANGNNWSVSNGSSYDVENRLAATNNAGQLYAYDYRNKRLVKDVAGAAELYFYGIDGRKLATYQCSRQANVFSCGSPVYDVYFGGKLVKSKGNVVVTDRLGSVRWHGTAGASSYYPYGEERTSTSDNREKFGTYVRDYPNQDYADQRYHAPGTGRFFTPDPAGFSAAISTEGNTWNRYAYSHGDPINMWDPSGLAPLESGMGDGNNGGEIDDDDFLNKFGSACWVNGKLYPPSYCDMFMGFGVVIGDGQTSIGVGGTRGPRPDGAMQGELRQALEKAGEILNSNADCAALFGGGDQQVGIAPKATTILAQIDNSFTFGEITAPPGTVTSATTKGKGNTSPWGSTDVIFSSVEIKLNNTTAGASFVDGNLSDWTVTILHELGHAAYDLYGPQASKITPDTGNTALSEANTRLIREKCRL
jgi:RHS repeat-associated protein